MSEKAGWLASGTLLYMWWVVQFAGKIRSDKERKHFLAFRAEVCDEPVCARLSRPVTEVSGADADSHASPQVIN